MNESMFENLLSEHADALLRGTLNRNRLLAKYNIASDSSVVQLLALAERLNAATPMVKPSDRFVAELYEDLVGLPHPRPWTRWARNRIDRLPNLGVDVQQPLEKWRQLPLTVQLAAGLGGLTLFFIATRRASRGTDLDTGQAEAFVEASTA